jgi:hypothetical protein
MSKIKFENGMTVNFDGDPTMADIEEVANKLGIQRTQEQPKEKGFLRQLGENIIRPAAEVGVSLYNAGTATKGLLTKNYEQAAKDVSATRNLPILGATKPAVTGKETYGQGVKKVFGYGLDIGSSLPLAGGVAGIAKAGWKGAIKQGLKTGAKEGAIYGTAQGAGKSLEEERSALNAFGSGVLGGIGGAIGGSVLGAGAGVVGKTIKGVLQPGKTISKIGEGIKEAGEVIQSKVIRPIQKDINAGFKIENVSKYNVGGNLGDSFVKVQNKIRENADKLKEIVSTISPSKRYKFDVKNYIDELDKKYATGGIRDLGQGRQKIMALQEMKKDLAFSLGENWEQKLLGFDDILAMKRQVGLNSAFLHDNMKSQPTPDEKVWTDFYMILKDRLEKEAPKEYQQVNKVMSDLIPIEQAIVRRIPIAERNNVLNIADVMSLVGATHNPAALSVGVINRLLKSGSVANVLMKTGKNIINKGEKIQPFDNLMKSIPKNNQGFATLPFSQKKSSIWGKTNKNPLFVKNDPLIQEAKKYKSAEEFVGKQIYLNKLEDAQLSSDAQKMWIENGKLQHYKRISDDTTSDAKVKFYEDNPILKNKLLNKIGNSSYADKTKNIEDAILDAKSKGIDVKIGDGEIRTSGAAGRGRIDPAPVVYFDLPQGQVSFHMPNWAEARDPNWPGRLTAKIPDEFKDLYSSNVKWDGQHNSIQNIIKTKSQLIDIWNKAHNKK